MQTRLIKRSACTLASYEAAMKALNSLQSNAKYLKLASQGNRDDSCKLHETEKYLLRSGITLEELDTLSVIHVAGTKGKGSTCAYTEAILREHGFTTGFYSSPHLVTVKERIRINGQPISQLCFTKYFWEVYKKLDDAKEHESDMPTYFKFLTILMFKIFLDTKVDVAIIEVGIGGLKDCTNIVRNPVCVGITSLALDHTNLLGNTLEDIAYQKSGIFKPQAIAFTVAQQPQALGVLKKRAVEVGCTLHIVPPFGKYKWENLSPILKARSNVQEQNASLAIQLATAWLFCEANKCSTVTHNTAYITRLCDKYNGNIEINSPTEQTQSIEILSMDKIAMGLSSCKWSGRMQILRSTIADFFLDGAHTIESMECCIAWFIDESIKGNGKKILVFNTSGTRNSSKLLMPLKSLRFFKAYFVPNFAGIEDVDDATNCRLMEEQRLKCKNNCDEWGSGAIFADSVFEVLQKVKEDSEAEMKYNNNEKYQILVTGSLHLVGAILAIVDPNLTMTTQF